MDLEILAQPARDVVRELRSTLATRPRRLSDELRDELAGLYRAEHAFKGRVSILAEIQKLFYGRVETTAERQARLHEQWAEAKRRELEEERRLASIRTVRIEVLWRQVHYGDGRVGERGDADWVEPETAEILAERGQAKILFRRD